MKLKELIARIDKSPDNKNEVDISRFGESVFDCHDMPFNWIEQDRLVSYWVSCWYCTDTWVGEQAYFLDDEVIRWDETYKNSAGLFYSPLHAVIPPPLGGRI